MTRPVTDAMVDRAFRTWCSCQAKDMSIEATLRACLASAVAPILSEVLLESPKFTARLNDRFFGLSDDTRQWLIDQADEPIASPAVAPGAPGTVGMTLRSAAERVCWFDWSGNDPDAVQAVDALLAALSAQDTDGVA